MLVCLTDSIFLGVIWIFKEQAWNYKTVVPICTTFVVMAIIIVRIKKIGNEDSAKETENALYDLKDILDNRFELTLEKPILLEERAIDYDLLDRQYLIDQLHRAIVNSNSRSSFVIGVEGAWGSGKTTLLNTVQKKIETKNDFLIINNFDPWLFGNQQSMLIGMYDSILKNCGAPYSIYGSRQTVRNIQSIVTGLSSAGGALSKAILPEQSDYEDTLRVKEQMRSFLRNFSKTIVFIIDNIDRAEADNVIFLFKIIRTFFDLPHLVYVTYMAELEQIIMNLVELIVWEQI